MIPLKKGYNTINLRHLITAARYISREIIMNLKVRGLILSALLLLIPVFGYSYLNAKEKTNSVFLHSSYGIIDLTISPDSNYIASFVKTAPIDHNIYVWSVNDFKKEKKLKITGEPRCITFTPDNKYLVVGKGTSTRSQKPGDINIDMWKIGSWDKVDIKRDIPTVYGNNVDAIAISPDSKELACGMPTATDGLIEFWDLETKKFRNILNISRWPKLISYSPDSKYLAVVDIVANEVMLFHADTKKHWKNIKKINPGRITSMTFHPSKCQIAIGYNGIGTKEDKYTRTIEVWDYDQGELIQNIQWESGGGLESVSYNPDGEYIASVEGKEIRLWETNSGILFKKYIHPDGLAFSMAFSPDNKYIAIGGSESIKLWNDYLIKKV